MREYLDAWDHISKKQKQGYEIGKLDALTKRAFKTDKIMRWKRQDPDTGKVQLVLYYTPVTKKLTDNAKRLGDYLHVPKKYHPEGDRWWEDFRKLLAEMLVQAKVAVMGTLLGPALVKEGKIHMNVHAPIEADLSLLRVSSQALTVKVDYLDAMPDKLEPEAIVWRI